MLRRLLPISAVCLLILGASAQTGKMVTTKSGLKYIDHKVGAGAQAVKGSKIQVHYTGWLYDKGVRGRKFDSSKDRGKPFIVDGLGTPNAHVIPGWNEGIQGMRVGGMRELIIPPKLAYGERGFSTVIPPNATLDFEIELLAIASK